MPVNGKIRVEVAKNLGHVLPIGILSGGKFLNEFSLRPEGLETPIEREIGRYRKANEQLPNTILVSKVVSELLHTLGGKPFGVKDNNEPMTRIEKQQFVQSMYLADAQYIYFCARMEELGNDYVFPFKCDQCGYMQEKAVVDLSNMDVHCVVDPSVLMSQVELKRGLRYRDGTIKKKVMVSPAYCFHMEDPEIMIAGGDPNLMRLFMIGKCITGVEGVEGQVPLSQSEVDSLRKIDLEILGQHISDVNLGPSLTLSGNCPNEICKIPFQLGLNWDYDHFFSMSSLF